MNAVELSAFDRSTTRLNSERECAGTGSRTQICYLVKREKKKRLTSRDFFFIGVRDRVALVRAWRQSDYCNSEEAGLDLSQLLINTTEQILATASFPAPLNAVTLSSPFNAVRKNGGRPLDRAK